jgi:hypothetical protein
VQLRGKACKNPEFSTKNKKKKKKEKEKKQDEPGNCPVLLLKWLL